MAVFCAPYQILQYCIVTVYDDYYWRVCVAGTDGVCTYISRTIHLQSGRSLSDLLGSYQQILFNSVKVIPQMLKKMSNYYVGVILSYIVINCHVYCILKPLILNVW